MKYIVGSIFLIILIDFKENEAFNDLELRITEDTVVVNHTYQEFELTIEFKNTTDTNLLLYGFDSNQISSTSIDRLCNVDGVGAGIAIILYNSSNKVQFPSRLIPDSLKYKPIPDSQFRQRLKEDSDKYFAGTRVSKRKEITVFKRKISLWRYSIQPGTYHLKVIYFCGRGIFDPNVIGRERIEIDKRKAYAETLLGCVVSNVVTLNVY